MNHPVKRKRNAGPSVSIIMPAFNKIEFTRRAIDAVIRNTAPGISWELILIDNASSDATASEQPWDGRVRIIHNASNLGFSRGCNLGAREACGKYLVFLNNDTEVSQGWLEPLIEELAEHRDTGAVGARLLYPNGKLQHAGVAVNRALIPYHILRHYPANHRFALARRSFPCITGACMAVRRNEFIAIGLFDEAFINGWEDVDLCYRYRKAGKLCVYRPECVVMHHESVSPGRNDKNEQNRKLFRERWQSALIQDDFAFLNVGHKVEGEKLRIAITEADFLI